MNSYKTHNKQANLEMNEPYVDIPDNGGLRLKVSNLSSRSSRNRKFENNRRLTLDDAMSDHLETPIHLSQGHHSTKIEKHVA